MEPGKQTFDFPASAVAPKLASVLGLGPAAVRLVGRDQGDAMLLLQARIQRITVVGAVADYTFGERRREALLDGSLDELGFMRRSACNPTATGKPRRSAIAMILVPLPRRVGPTAPPPFSHC